MHKIIEYTTHHKQVLMFLFLPVYLIWFLVIEKTITQNYWASYLPLDDKIPFVPAFVLAYVLWYPAVLLPALYLYFKDTGAFRRYGWYTIISLSISLLICTVFPNGQDLRPVLTQPMDVFTMLISLIYAADTNTNVLPSMHVVGCMGVVFGLFYQPDLKKWRGAIILLMVIISLSTVFIKQHSVLDLLAGLALSVLIGWLIYRKKSPLWREKPPLSADTVEQQK